MNYLDKRFKKRRIEKRSFVGKITKSQIKFVILCVLFLVATLNLPKISLLFSFTIPLIARLLGYLNIPKYLLKLQIILIPIISLILFIFVNFTILFWLDLTDIIKTMFQVMTIIILFFTSIALDFKKMPFFPFNMVIINILLFSGGIIWVFLSVGKSTEWNLSLGQFFIQDRSALSFWSNSGEEINGPSLDMFSYLGVSMIGIIIAYVTCFGLVLKNFTWQKSIPFIGIFGLVIMSCYSSIALGARTPIMVFSLSLITSVIFINFSDQSKNLRIVQIFFYCLIGLMLILSGELLIKYALQWSNILFDVGIGERFVNQGFETSRYQLWVTTIDQMWDFPWGGRKMDILGQSYVHNIWLDQLFETGIFPMILLLTYHLLQIPILLQFFRLKLPLIVHVFVLCTLIAFMGAFIQAPVLQASNIYFAMSCFFFGSVARFTVDVSRMKKNLL